jgi:5'(3')-deoxyribonucleotidase
MTRRIYLDCDGVLANFDLHFEHLFGHPPKHFEEHFGSKEFWYKIRSAKPGFFRHIPLMSDAMKLFHSVESLRPVILTGTPFGGWAEGQKLGWAREFFPSIPMVCCPSKDKVNYCKPGDILIDDWDKYKTKWEDVGGIFLIHTSAEDTIATLTNMDVIA